MDMVDQLHMRGTVGYVEPSIDELEGGPKVVAGVCGWRLHQGEAVPWSYINGVWGRSPDHVAGVLLARANGGPGGDRPSEVRRAEMFLRRMTVALLLNQGPLTQKLVRLIDEAVSTKRAWVNENDLTLG